MRYRKKKKSVMVVNYYRCSGSAALLCSGCAFPCGWSELGGDGGRDLFRLELTTSSDPSWFTAPPLHYFSSIPTLLTLFCSCILVRDIWSGDRFGFLTAGSICHGDTIPECVHPAISSDGELFADMG